MVIPAQPGRLGERARASGLGAEVAPPAGNDAVVLGDLVLDLDVEVGTGHALVWTRTGARRLVR